MCACNCWCTKDLGSVVGFEKRHGDVIEGFKHDPYRHADSHIGDWAVDDVGDLSKATLLGQLDDGNHVRFRRGRGAPLMMIDGEGGHDALPADGLRDQFTGETVATNGGWWVIPQATGSAAKNTELAGQSASPIVAVQISEQWRYSHGAGFVCCGFGRS
jgi:hypothetical protein